MPALLGFNIGVEAGQLAVVAALLPLLCVVRHSVRYRRIAVSAGSGAVALVGVAWSVQRLAG